MNIFFMILGVAVIITDPNAIMIDLYVFHIYIIPSKKSFNPFIDLSPIISIFYI